MNLTEVIRLIAALLPYLLPFLVLGAVGIRFITTWMGYRKSTYFDATGFSIVSVLFNKGRYGEFLIYHYLKKYEKHGSKFLFNLYIPKDNGQTTELDVLMIDQAGIFVFESKNYSGWIFGNETDKTWCQMLPSRRGTKSRKERFYNPVKQNQSHIEWLRKLVGDLQTIHSFIVFSERCTLKNVTIFSKDIQVIRRSNVKSSVEKIRSKNTMMLSDSEIKMLYETLKPYENVDEETKRRHIDNIRCGNSSSGIFAPAEPGKCAAHICPRCGGGMILRTASRGTNAGKQFYGCSNYPKCRYTESIKNKTV